jgi:hypothetical protein
VAIKPIKTIFCPNGGPSEAKPSRLPWAVLDFSLEACGIMASLHPAPVADLNQQRDANNSTSIARKRNRFMAKALSNIPSASSVLNSSRASPISGPGLWLFAHFDCIICADKPPGCSWVFSTPNLDGISIAPRSISNLAAANSL